MKFRVGEKRKNGTFSFDTIVQDMILEFDLEKSFTIEMLQAQWYSIVGDIISTHSKPDRIYKKILFVAVDHSAYGNEIILMKDNIIKNINHEFPYQVIRDIKAEIKKIHW
jgi:predicted nucleic acid-binding Zn ribbon protein